MNRKTASFKTVSLVYVLVALSLVLGIALAGCRACTGRATGTGRSHRCAG